MVALECAHAHLLKLEDNAIPNAFSPAFQTEKQRYDFGIYRACWDAYAANLLIGTFNDKFYNTYVESFRSQFKGYSARVRGYKEDYGRTGDGNALFSAMMREYVAFFKFASGYLGQVIALEKTRPLARTALNISAFLGGDWSKTLFASLEKIYTDLWSRSGQWKSWDEFTPITDLIYQLMGTQGITVLEKDGALTATLT